MNALVLIRNAMFTAYGDVLANRQPLTEEQKRAIHAKMSRSAAAGGNRSYIKSPPRPGGTGGVQIPQGAAPSRSGSSPVYIPTGNSPGNLPLQPERPPTTGTPVPVPSPPNTLLSVDQRQIMDNNPNANYDFSGGGNIPRDYIKPFDNFRQFSTAWDSFREQFPAESGKFANVAAIIQRFAESPAALLRDSGALAVIERAFRQNVAQFIDDPPRPWDNRKYFESGQLSGMLNILHAAGLATEYEPLSRLSHPGTKFTNHLAQSAIIPITPSGSGNNVLNTTIDGRITSAQVGTKGMWINGQWIPGYGGPAPVVTPPAYTQPNAKGIGSWNPNQPYVPGQPRVGFDGRPYYGPKPGEQGYIDPDAFHRGAQPVIPGRVNPTPQPIDRRDT
jgi:hypothetical protein